MATLDKLTIKLECKNFNKAIRAINRATNALNRLNKASDKCAEAFKNLKENIPMEIEFEQGEIKR